MPVIDEDGNLFGVVNVIDALAVLLVLAVLVAGVAVIGVLGDEGDPETRYATVDLGSQPDYVVERVSAGDEMVVDGHDHALTVTDVYVSPAAPENESDGRVTVRAQLDGERVERDDRDPAFEFAGERVRVGTDLEIETDEYVATGRVTSVESEGDTLPVETTSALLEAEASTSTATDLAEGDEYRIGPHAVATVTGVQTSPVEEDRHRVRMDVELATIRRGGTATFAGESVTVGSDLTIRTGSWTLPATVLSRGSTALEGAPATRFATIELGAQPDYIVERVSAGDAMNVSDERLTVTDVHVSPADGDDANLTVRARVDGRLVETLGRDDRVFQFAGDHLRVGDDIGIDIDEYDTRGQVTSLEPDGTDLATEATPVLLETTAPARTADEIAEGDEYRIGPHAVATVTTVRTYPVGPEQRRVVAGVELDTVQRGSTPRFAGQPVTVGSRLELRTDAYDVTGEVIRRGADEPAGDPTTTAVEIELENVKPEVADGLEAGMAETERGEPLATIAAVDTRPAEVVLESEDGDIHLREHPTNLDVTLTADLETLQTETGLRFHGESVREGDTVTLDFGTTIVRGDVIDLDPESESE